MKDNAQPARWYMIDKDGMATLCTDREDAEKEAKDANMAWPHTAPHRAVQLVEAASLAASAGSEPVIGWHAFPHYLQHPDGRLLRTASDLLARHGYQGCAEPLRAMSDVLLPTNPSPPEGMVGGWVSVDEMLPDLYKRVLVITTDADDEPYAAPAHYNGPGKFLAAGGHRLNPVTHWQEIDAPPVGWKLPPAKPRVSHRRKPSPSTNPAGSGKGE